MTESAIFFDSSHCTDCKACQVACKCWNDLPSPLATNASRNAATEENHLIGTYQNPPDLDGDTRLVMACREYEGIEAYKPVNWAFTRRSCQHCTDAGCVRVCPTGALSHDEDTGLVVVDQDKCIACHYCRTGCPFDVPRYAPAGGLPGAAGVIEKCDGCASRVARGLKPACVATCQPRALDFGSRQEMVDKANARVTALKELGYEDAEVYGVDEMDGLHVIQVLKYGAARHGMPESPKLSAIVPLSEIAKPLAAVGVGAVVVGLGISYANGRGYDHGELRYDERTGTQYRDGEVVAQFDPAEIRASEELEPVHKVSRRGTKGGE